LKTAPADDDAVRIADRLHTAGSDLLSGGLEELLRSCGQVTVSGSYYLDLMAWPDLDIYLPLESSDEYLAAFISLGPRVASICDVVSLRFKNHVRYPAPELPAGLYWGVRAQQDPSLQWKLDIWALSLEVIQAQQRELDRLKEVMTPEARVTILQLKQALLTPEGRTPVFSGYHIYCAVIDHGMRDLEQVKQYLTSKGVSV
jgi:hypothetical protein